MSGPYTSEFPPAPAPFTPTSNKNPHGKCFEATVAEKLFRLNWLLLAAMLAVLDITLLLTDFRIRPTGYLAALVIASVYGVCGRSHARSPRGRLWISSMPTGIAQIILVVSVMISMTYMAAAANFPLQDARLLAFGFDGPS
jgi:hypothetical protein